MKSLIINEKYNGKKLNQVLLDAFPYLNSNSFFKALRKKDIKINGKRIHENVTVFSNDTIEIYLSEEHFQNIPKFSIVYEDEHILLVDKPAGIEITGEQSLTSLLEKQFSFISPCHRLDRNTSGLVLYAKNTESLSILLEKFKSSEIEKHYACLVYGIPKEKAKTLNAYLFKDAKKSYVYISDVPKKGYRPILTSYQVLQEFSNNTCILDITLHTGRTHQIRAHLGHIGYPIIGDGKYGNNKINKALKAKTQKLCSYQLKFHFHSDSGILNYLNQKQFKIEYHFD